MIQYNSIFLKEDLARNFFVARKCRALNHGKLMELSGFTRPVFSGIENSAVNPTFETLGKLANILGIDLDLLLISKSRFEKLQNLLRSEFERNKMIQFEMVFSESLWRRLMSLSENKIKNNYRKIIDCNHEVVNFNFPDLSYNSKNVMVYCATLGFIFQENGFKEGIEFGIWIAAKLYNQN